MKPNITKSLLAVLLGTGLSQGSLFAQNTFFTDGDLILFFQKPGNKNTIYVGLGSAATLYRGAAAGPTAGSAATNIVNISAALSAAFNTDTTNWASDPDIYSGLIACRSSGTGTQVFSGDHTRTIYASRSRTAGSTVGSAGSDPWDFTLSGANTTVSQQVIAFNNSFETNSLTKATTLDIGVSLVDNQNPFLSVSQGIQDTAFKGFPGGVQQRGSASSLGAFGPVSNAEFLLDLWRITARPDSETAGEEVSGVSRVGSYEGTIAIGADGNVSFVTQGAAPPTSPYQDWALSFPALDTEAKRLPSADPDSDGLTNQMEFVLNGNPGVSDSPPILPTLNAAGTDFVFTFKRRDDSEANNTLVFQYGINLMDWTDVAVGASGATVGGATVGIVENSTNPDSITLTVPKSVAPGGKLFGRLKATQP